MDKELFKQKTQGLLRYSARLERDVLVKQNTAEVCGYCDSTVINQRLECSAYRLGTVNQHFKHKCKNCNSFVFDGSVKSDQIIRPIKIFPSSYVKKLPENHTGAKRGRPRKYVTEREPLPLGRPRKNPTP